jgi:positive regulator of sigma E activity
VSARLGASRRCLTANGRVTRCQSGIVEIELGAPVGCPGCNGACLWRALRESQRLQLATVSHFSAGEAVVVALPERLLMAGVLLLHGLPLGALLLGAAAGFAAGGSDLATGAGAIAGIALAWPTAAGLRRWLERQVVAEVSVRAERPHAKAHAL